MKKKILIIAGGYSKEREITLKTARSGYRELKKSKKYIVEVTEPDGNFVKNIKILECQNDNPITIYIQTQGEII